VISMNCIALTGISRQVLKDLMTNRLRTIEIRSPQNFFTIRAALPGDRIFLTEATFTDVVAGTSGLIALVKEVQTMTHRTVQSSDYYYEEIESQAARVQLQLLGLGRARRIVSFEPGQPLTLEVDEVRHCSAR